MWLSLSSGSRLEAAPPEADFLTRAKPLLERHCFDCHGADEQNGSIDFSAIADQAGAMGRYDLWKKVAEQVGSGSMPPETETPLAAADKQQLLGWIDAAFNVKDNPGPPLTRQLTREEYGNTLRDLFGYWFDVTYEAGIFDERVTEGFANRAGGLVLQPSLMEKFFTGADIAIDKLFSERGAEGARKAFLAAAASETIAPADGVRKALRPFMRKAFRRPVSDEELERYAAVADAALARGETLEQSLRRAMKPVLVSPWFLLRIESSPPEGAVARVSDHELAVRLSYFLWGTMPDNELATAADQGTLSQPEVLEKQVRRMLAHGRGDSLTRFFLMHWLQMPQIHKSLPQQNHFPTFTRSLRDSMERETWMFCDNLRKEDRSILELLDADYTFINKELARHYRMPEPEGNDFVKVSLSADNHRGGVVSMASMLTMTSHTDRTKPTARGKWVLDVLLGTPPPPPPANAGSFAPPDKNRPEPTSFREKLAQHATNANCVGCHKRIDPLGFALENYDAIGAWRDSVGDTPVDNAGKLPGIGEFRGVDGLRTVLKSKQPQFVRNMAAQTLSYALGREVSYYDEPALKEITTALEQHEYRFSALILAVVESYPFQHRQSE